MSTLWLAKNTSWCCCIYNSATNIYRIAKTAINGLERPKYLCREKNDENIKVEKPKKEKVKKVVQKKVQVNKSVKVVALTKS